VSERTVSTGAGIGLLGYGYWGTNLARNVVASGHRLVAVADADAARRAAAETNHPGVRTVESLDGLLTDGEVEGVVIASPAAMHHEMAAATLASGRHVLVEKPLAMTVADADDLVARAEDAGRVLMVGHTFLYSPSVRRLREYIDDGALGTLQYLYSQRLSLGRIRRDCNALWNFAPHDLSIMLYLVGEPIVEVSARGFSFIEQGIDDVCFASLVFESGIGANLHVSWIDPRKTRLMTVVGDQKMVIYNDVSADQKLWLVDAGVARSTDGFGAYESMGDFQWRTRAGDIQIPHIEMVEPLKLELQAFGSACQTGEPPLTDGRHGAAVVRALAAIDASVAAGGAPVEVAR
jgi:predicted dehydrogenase